MRGLASRESCWQVRADEAVAQKKLPQRGAGSSRTDRSWPRAPTSQNVLVSPSVPIEGGALACFNHQWPKLNFAVA